METALEALDASIGVQTSRNLARGRLARAKLVWDAHQATGLSKADCKERSLDVLHQHGWRQSQVNVIRRDRPRTVVTSRASQIRRIRQRSLRQRAPAAPCSGIS
jgi:hypothetical protein